MRSTWQMIISELLPPSLKWQLQCPHVALSAPSNHQITSVFLIMRPFHSETTRYEYPMITNIKAARFACRLYILLHNLATGKDVTCNIFSHCLRHSSTKSHKLALGLPGGQGVDGSVSLYKTQLYRLLSLPETILTVPVTTLIKQTMN